MARQLRVLPLESEGGVLTLAMANIFDLDAVEEVERHTHRLVEVVGASEEEVAFCTAQAYGNHRRLDEVIEEAIQAAEGGAPATDMPVAGPAAPETPPPGTPEPELWDEA